MGADYPSTGVTIARRFTDMPVPSDSTEPGTLEIDLCSGHRLRITGAYDGDALARLIRGLSS